MTAKRIVFVLSFLLAYTCVAVAQTDTGTPSYEPTMQVNPYESVNLATLSILLQAPVRSKGGPIPLNFILSNNVQLYVSSGSYATAASQTLLTRGYWAGQIKYMVFGGVTCLAGGVTIEYLIQAIVDQNGTAHPLPGVGVRWDQKGCKDGDVDAYTVDNTGYEVVIPHGNGIDPGPKITVYNRVGTSSTAYGTGTSYIADAHGNQVTITQGGAPNHTITYTDELTSTPVISYPSLQAAGTAINYTYTDGTSSSRNVTASYQGGTSGVTMLPAFACPSISNTSTTMYPLASVAYPDGSVVNFTWQKTGANNLTGRLATVQVPTGATFTHAYSGGTNGDGLWCESSSKISNATMTISNGTGTWTFARTPGSGFLSTTTVTKPDGSVTVYSFNTNIVTQVVAKDTDGTTVLDTMTYCYDSTFASCNPVVPTQHPTWLRAYHTVPGVTGNAEVDTNYDMYGSVVEIDRFGFGPTLVNKQFLMRGNYNPSTSACDAPPAHALGTLCANFTTNAAGQLASGDAYIHYSNVGDPLSVMHIATPTLQLSEYSTYNSNGTMASHTAVDGAATSYGNAQCNGFLPDHATSAIGTASMTWDCNGGRPLTSTDLNGLTVTNTYGDPLYRLTQLSDNGGGAPINYSYPSTTRAIKQMTFTSAPGFTAVDDTTTTVNPLGQVASIQHQISPSNTSYETVSYGYDASGHKTSVSVPCTTTIGGSCGTHAVEYAYDGMGRLKTKTVKTATPGVLTYSYPNGDIKTVLTPAPTGENSKIVQIEKDGLGRTVSTCAVVTAGLSGTGSCGQRTAASGYLTKLTLDPIGRATLVSRNAQTGATPVNSTAVYDFLGRPTSTTFPESGTTTFQYDSSNNDCASGLLGHLNRKVDAVGNETCYSYEGMGRLSGITHPAGPYASVTAPKYYCWDGTCNGAGSNLKGRLDNAGTNFGVDLQFSYDKYGRTTDLWETAPAISPSYIHTTASYFDNGAIQSVGGVPGVSSITYTLDGRGRPYSATAGATGLVSSVTYDAASNPTNITFTNGDKDDYTWDAPSQNMSQFKFTIGTGAVTDTGVPTWNPNGTLKQLVITDNLTSTDTQTCTTSHDDLIRITTWNCGALANATYAYSPDYAGNVTKAGTFNFAPGYTPSNNRFLGPYTYDANGNVLHDATGNFNYTWDSMGNLVTSGGNPLVNDAFGSTVQKTVGSTNTYFVESPVGMLGTASSLTAALSIRIPLPGGSSITYGTGGAQQINHKDFRGSGTLVTNRAARTLVGVFCYGPMGEIYCGTSASSQFEGTFQDTQAGLDDYGPLRYRGTWGRSISPTGGANGYVKTNSPF